MSKQPITRTHTESLRALTLTIIKSIVDNPEDVEVNIVPSSYRLIVELHTARSDVGQVIGKDGRVVSAVRCLLTAHGGREGMRIEMDYITEKKAKSKRD